MVLELHVWGPAFGLPSIDPACSAAIARFRQCLQPNEWSLIPGSDPSASPLGELPALKDGDLWVAGYRSIVTYLNDVSAEMWDIDRNLQPQQLSECTAYLSFIESQGLPLLDLLLYVSSENYNASTKPALGELLSWPTSWILPGRLRMQAKRRSEHLGLSGLDVDTIGDDKGRDDGLTAQIPASVRKPRLTVSSMLGRDMRKNKFRLDAVASAFLDPLEEMLGEKQWLFGDHPSTTDCLAVSVLALMYMPKDLANPWIRTAIDAKHPRLANWIEKQSTALFGSRAHLDPAAKGRKHSWVDLPWHQPAARSWQDAANAVARTSVEAIPVLGSCSAVYAVTGPTADSHTEKQQQKQISLNRLRGHQLLYSQILLSSLALTTLVGALLWKGIFFIPRWRSTSRLRNFGEAGNMLGLG